MIYFSKGYKFMKLTKYKKKPTNLTISMAYERYFADRFKNYDTFYSFAFRKGKEHLKRLKIDNTFYINENHIIRYLRTQEIKEIRKDKYLALLYELELEKKLHMAGKLLGFKYPVQIYDINSYGKMGAKTIRLFKKNYTKLIDLLNQKETN